MFKVGKQYRHKQLGYIIEVTAVGQSMCLCFDVTRGEPSKEFTQLHRVFDLYEEYKKPITYTKYFNFYPGGICYSHDTREEADAAACERVISRRKIVVTEGEYDD